MKILYKIFIIILILSFVIIYLPKNDTHASEEDIYDIILFWGQSNMTGYAGTKAWEHNPDERITKYGIDTFSKYSGINKSIVANTKAVNYVEVTQEPGTAFEFLYFDKDGKPNGQLRDLSTLNINNRTLGEKLTYNPSTKTLEKYSSSKHKYYTIQKTYGTNMIPQFCKEYYSITGRKVVAVLCSNGGEKIANFLPHNDPEYADTKNQYIYEAMVEKYSSAEKYITNTINAKVGNKLYVVSQGGSDVLGTTVVNSSTGQSEYTYTSQEDYVRRFRKIDDALASDVDIKKGAIVVTGLKPAMGARNSDPIKKVRYEKAVQTLYDAQAELIGASDIILGSLFAFNNYIPTDFTNNATFQTDEYKFTSSKELSPNDKVINYRLDYTKTPNLHSKFKDSSGNKYSFSKSLTISRLSLCYTNTEVEVDKNGNPVLDSNGNPDIANNEIHFTSAGLSQIGYECAVNFSKVSIIRLIKKPTKLNYFVGDTLDTTGIELHERRVSGIEHDITSKCTYSPTKFTTDGTQTVTATYVRNNDGVEKTYTTTFDVNVEKVKLNRIEITTPPSKNNYIEGQNFSPSGMVVKAYYNNNTSKTLSNNDYKLTNNSNLKADQTSVTISYTEDGITKTIQQPISVAKKTLTNIVIKTLPTKTNYFEGEILDNTGLALTANYNDGTKETITKGFTCSPTLLSNVGEQEITITYSGLKTSFKVNVEKIKLTSIEITTPPSKTFYIKGQDFNPSGMVVKAYYNNNTSKLLTSIDYTLTNNSNLKTDQTSITISYTEDNITKTTEQHITVSPKALADIAIKTLPTKTNYFQGDSLDTSGLILTVHYNDGSEQDITKDFNCSPTLLSNTGEQIITVTYGELKTSFKVNVEKVKLTSIKITTPPSNTDYIEGQNFSPSGMVVKAYYNNNTSKTLSNNDYKLTNNSNLKADQTSVTISYTEDSITKTIQQPITVAKKALTNIVIKTLPTKTNYFEGETLIDTGLTLTANYNDGTEETITKDFTCSPTLLSNAGEQIITVTYSGLETSFKVNVEKIKLTSIEITTPPSTTTYIEGQNFDPSGMIVYANYNNNNRKTITNYDIIDGSNLTARQSSVTISYTENNITKTIKQTITVKETLTVQVKEESEYKLQPENNKLYLENVTVNESINELLEKIKTTGSVKIKKGSQEISDYNTNVVTGMTIEFYNEFESQTIDIVVKGDSNGDGLINATDLILAVKQFKYTNSNGQKGKSLTGSYYRAIKHTETPKYTALDLIGQVKMFKKYKTLYKEDIK